MVNRVGTSAIVSIAFSIDCGFGIGGIAIGYRGNGLGGLVSVDDGVGEALARKAGEQAHVRANVHDSLWRLIPKYGSIVWYDVNLRVRTTIR